SGARGSGGTNYTGGYTPSQSVVPTVFFNNMSAVIDSAQGPNGTFGYGGDVVAPLAGFSAEKSPGQSISRVELALYSYVPATLDHHSSVNVQVSIAGQTSSNLSLNHSLWDAHTGLANAGAIYIDITGLRAPYGGWQ